MHKLLEWIFFFPLVPKYGVHIISIYWDMGKTGGGNENIPQVRIGLSYKMYIYIYIYDLWGYTNYEISHMQNETITEITVT